MDEECKFGEDTYDLHYESTDNNSDRDRDVIIGDIIQPGLPHFDRNDCSTYSCFESSDMGSNGSFANYHFGQAGERVVGIEERTDIGGSYSRNEQPAAFRNSLRNRNGTGKCYVA